jgi:hypothetical protein
MDPKRPENEDSQKLTKTSNVASSSAAGLVVEPKASGSDKEFEQQLAKALDETERAFVVKPGLADANAESWRRARKIVQDFRPVPWFIWRLSNFVLGKPEQITPVSEGLVFGLRRLLFAAASDPVLGAGRKVNTNREALHVLPPDVVAAVAVIHAICRRLAASPVERVWRPIIEDALVRATIGHSVGRGIKNFGSGRGMLAGFAGRCGLAVLLATGDDEQATHALEKLASGVDIKNVGLKIYQCDPLQVSAMILSAAGCGRDAAFGTVSFASIEGEVQGENSEQRSWLVAFAVIEALRTGRSDKLNAEYWKLADCSDQGSQAKLAEMVKTISRRGHGWSWLV